MGTALASVRDLGFSCPHAAAAFQILIFFLAFVSLSFLYAYISYINNMNLFNINPSTEMSRGVYPFSDNLFRGLCPGQQALPCALPQGLPA